jgi:predicted KAP-like P-loop ATPase
MNKRKPVYIISDDPARKNKVVFGFEAYARTLAELIAFRDNRTPLVVGIYGPWGSGKTTLMEAIITKLDELNTV